jgi:hypothetical protein
LSIHGGSLRITVSKRAGKSARLSALIREEEELGMGTLAFYRSFSARVEDLRARLTKFLHERHRAGYRLAAYGAAAKGATLLNTLGLEPGVFEYVVDRNPHKVGKYMPGVKLPISPVARLTENPPDYVLILAWNFAEEIMSQNQAYAEGGGRFILPAPELRVA